MIRRAAVAGYFYEGSKERLRSQVEDLIDREAAKGRVIGVVAPHAGYLYSGKVAGALYSRIEFPETFVILGPNHTGLGAGAAIMSYGSWETPLGEVKIDEDLAQAIMGHSQTLEEDHLGHLKEHSIEVQLPFLQYFGHPFQFVPICLFSHESAVCQDVGRAVAAAIKESGKSVVVVASTDMSHYTPHETAKEKDMMAVEAILALDPDRLYQTVRRERISMCGFHPTTAALVTVRELGATQAELVRYMTSGDTTKDYRSVVGYAGLVIK
ncbi:MAG: AmmeMemoRadiSam system protein B [candidate division NC10 bacterium]|nr:AmmeMemoRadiSam system protein B [candidate division NC10 bacterium]